MGVGRRKRRRRKLGLGWGILLRMMPDKDAHIKEVDEEE